MSFLSKMFEWSCAVLAPTCHDDNDGTMTGDDFVTRNTPHLAAMRKRAGRELAPPERPGSASSKLASVGREATGPGEWFVPNQSINQSINVGTAKLSNNK